jgi:hypothetical protein
MFTSWLFEQQDREDRVGMFARTAFTDYNAGCGSANFDAVAWKKHFDAKHPRHGKFLIELLGDAFVEYSTLAE